MSAASLQSVLRARGLRCRVEDRERLAVVVPDDEEALEAVLRVREAILDSGRAHGFTHVALELSAQPPGATLPRG